MTLATLRAALKAHADPEKALSRRKFFKDCRGDKFLGVPTPTVRKIAKENRALSLRDILKLMQSSTHDERSLANEILVLQFKKADDAQRTEIYKFFLHSLLHPRLVRRRWFGSLHRRTLLNRPRQIDYV